ncbi:hypothetical protein MUK42_34002 [Musa troglodytarum]|uniref:Uncharacterized protein n=1 Tax=Musa troglodytarum TaxID=320322 RepID=A0A9E7FH45_9LILI|nr:hypothetical protein MUK42_34002 [Musa troglodytarum]
MWESFSPHHKTSSNWKKAPLGNSASGSWRSKFPSPSSPLDRTKPSVIGPGRITGEDEEEERRSYPHELDTQR